MIQTSGPESSSLKQQLEYRKRLMDKINEIHCADNLNTILLDIKTVLQPCSMRSGSPSIWRMPSVIC